MRWPFPTRRVVGAVAAVVTLLVALVLGGVGCGGSPSGEGFAIYLPATDIPPSRLAALSHIEIADAPLVASDDVVAYAAGSHEIELTPAAYERIAALEVPVSGLSFAVCVDRAPVYAGAFWTEISSASFDGVVIMKAFSPESTPESSVIRLELGYPGRDFFTGADPRPDPVVLDALRQAGKLR